MCRWRSERCKRHRKEKLALVNDRLQCHSCLWEKQMEKEETAAKTKSKAQAQVQKAKPSTEKTPQTPSHQSPKPSIPPQPTCPRCNTIFQTPTELNEHYDPPTPIGCHVHCSSFIYPNDALNHAHEHEHDRCFFEGCPSHLYPTPGGNKQVINHILEYHTVTSQPWPATPASERDPEDIYPEPLSEKPARESKRKTKRRHHTHLRKSAVSDVNSERYYDDSTSDSESGYSRRSRHHRSRHSRSSKNHPHQSSEHGYSKYEPTNPAAPSVYARISIYFPISVYPPTTTFPLEPPPRYIPSLDW